MKRMSPNWVLALDTSDELVASLTPDCKISRGNAAILETCFESFCFHGGRMIQAKGIYVES